MLRIVLLVAALAAGGGAAWMAVSLRGGSTVETVVEQAIPVPVQDVLVAAADLGQGHALAKEDMRWQSWPESALNPAYITRSARPDAPETLAGSAVHIRLISGEPIRDENLASLNTGSLSAMLPSGKRAVAVAILAPNFAGGLIQQNDRVDVISTVAPTPTETKTQTATATETKTKTEGQPVSTRILWNVRVLAIDLATEATVDERSKDEKGKAKGVFLGKTATLELHRRWKSSPKGREQRFRLRSALRRTTTRSSRSRHRRRP
jgi:pilus assembly protein CpaB